MAVTVMLGALLILTACHRSAQTKENNGIRQYQARGIIRGFAPDRKTIEIEHEDIPGFMPSMTMPFSVPEPKDIATLAMGDAISFRLSITNQDSWVDQIKKINAGDVQLPAPTATPGIRSSTTVVRLREGDILPLFELTNQRNEHISLETFRGRPLVLTFIFTRCPLPNFCPLMSKNFADLQQAIKNGSGPLSGTRLLSISFDPEYDTPPILKSLAEHEQAEPGIWTFATGEKTEIDDLTHEFSVYLEREGGTISHGLATALIDRGGTIRKIWRGNGWTPNEIIEEIKRLE